MLFPTHTGTTAVTLPSILHWCCEPPNFCSVWHLINILSVWALMEFTYCLWPSHSASCADNPFCRIVGLGFSVCQQLATRKGTVWQVIYVILCKTLDGKAQDANENLFCRQNLIGIMDCKARRLQSCVESPYEKPTWLWFYTLCVIGTACA